MSKQDITGYSENELSLLVFNDEYLYKMRRQRDFLNDIKKMFEYTSEQLEVLKQDLEDDAKESGI